MKILVIDDDPAVLRSVKNKLELQGWHVDIATNYDLAIERVGTNEYDVLICDYRLSEDQDAKQGLDFAKELRKRKIHMPIIFLTGRKIDEITPEEALDSGIDDFVTKPWRPDELVARVKAVMRRTFAVPDNSTDLIRYGDITLDISRKRVLVQNKEVHFGNILFLLIKKFLQHPGKLLTYDDLIAYVWNKTATARQEHKNTLRVHVTNLKKALGNKYSKYLHTVHGEGYVWEE